MQLKKFCTTMNIALIASGVSAHIFADQIALNSNIIYGNKNTAKLVAQYKPAIKQMQININNHGWKNLSIASNYGQTTLNNGDKYTIQVKATDGKWYHTQTISYYTSQNPDNQGLITINGIITPLNLVFNGVEMSQFYDANDWPAIGISCGGAPTEIFSCNFNGPNKIGNFMGSNLKNIGEFDGTGYFDPSLEIGDEATFWMSSVSEHANITWWSSTKIKVGYANMDGIGITKTVGDSGVFGKI